jgi:hypothetical protein
MNTKESREMKITLLTLVALFLPLIGFAVDTDGDGMTDVAELKYGFDPNDADSFPQSFYTEDVSEKSQSLDGKLGTDDDIVYYNFRDYTDESTIEKCKDFINKVLPIMYYRLGHPANTMNIRFWKRYPKNSGWMCIPKTSPWILSDGSFEPRLIVHEMFHAWTAIHGMTSRSQNNKIGNYDPIFSGWEEVAEGVCQEILIDFTKAYPTDSANSVIRNLTFSTITSYKFDLQKNLEYLHGGTFWTDGLSSMERYGLSAGVAQHFMIADEQFYKRFFEKYYAEIHQNPNYRVTSERLINLYSSVLPEVNGISTEKFLGDVTSLRGTKLPNKFQSVVRQDRRFNSTLQVFCGFADSNKGELWWTSSIKTKDELASHGIPSWFPTFHANDGYFYTDTRNEEYVLTIKKLNGEVVKEINGKVFSGSRNDGGPMNVAHDSPSASYASNFDLGLYKANVAFPRFKNFTEDYISEDVYYFGLKGTTFSSKTRRAYIGIDTNASVSEIKLKIGDEVFLPNKVGDNVVEISMSSIPWDFRGVAELIVTSEENVSHTFKRSVTFLTSPDRPKIGIVKWLIVDVNFDGVEDMYGSASDNEEVIVDDTTTPIVDNNDTEVVVDAPKEDDTTTPVVDNNDTEVVVDAPKEDDTTTSVVDNNDTEVVVDAPKEDDTEVVVDTPKEEVVEDSLNFKITHKDGVIRFTWNADFESHIADERFLHVWWSKLGPLQGTLIYGGHAHDSAEFELAKYNFNGTETIGIEVLDYFNNHYVRKGLKAFEVNLADVIANSTEQEVVENDTTPIVDNNDTEVVVDTPKEDDTTTPIVDNNDTEVVVDAPKEDDTTTPIVDNNDTEVVVDAPKEDDTTNEVVRKAPELPPVVTNAWDSATDVGNNWFFVEWFGYFYKVEGNGWVFNEKLGWFYTEWTSSFNSVWLFHEDLGWVWTTSEFFPYLYNPKTASWVYIVEGGFFDFNTNEWKVSE